jgi:oxygen-independent coproporphyrinogen-3 oxidase
LRQALALAADHLSLYQLTIEPGTAFEARYRQNEFTLPDDETASALYDATAEESALRGLHLYEVSNYARPGAESRHNLAYWRYQDFIGIGPGAHGRLKIGDRLIATRRHRAPEIWADRVEQHGHAAESEDIAPHDRAREALLMGLRLTEGIDAGHFQERTGIALADALDPDILSACLDENYLTLANGRLAATKAGRQRLNAVLERLVR